MTASLSFFCVAATSQARTGTLSKRKQYKAEAFAAIHETMDALHQIGAVNKKTLRDYARTATERNSAPVCPAQQGFEAHFQIAFSQDPLDGSLLEFLGEVSELRAHLRRLGMAAGFTPAEWTGYQALTEERLHLTL
jgi:hypothetical protein